MTDRINPSRDIPDLIAETPEGKFDVIEVRSLTDDPIGLDARMEAGLELLPPGARGQRAVVDPIESGVPNDPFAQ